MSNEKTNSSFFNTQSETEDTDMENEDFLEDEQDDDDFEKNEIIDEDEDDQTKENAWNLFNDKETKRVLKILRDK